MTFPHQDLVRETGKLRKFAMKLCANAQDADDLLQETVLRALEKRTLFQEGTDLYKWTSKIMFNLFVSQYRRKVKFETQYDCEDLINNRATDSSQQGYMELRQVDEAMNSLSSNHRHILISVCVKGMKYEEVANDLDLPVGTVRSRLSRARESLKQAMENRNGGGRYIARRAQMGGRASAHSTV